MGILLPIPVTSVKKITAETILDLCTSVLRVISDKKLQWNIFNFQLLSKPQISSTAIESDQLSNVATW
ncbi:predicted protein [Sclerotinia sclerotiorum 1980 UF-70]|uniref:Uncharacterized protein n=1 Tax=Sclerotinia sclerotiorum (strain ATCC 18683 / 1980 / Ss-1) TaxID=665079 RepID=A7EJJ9_SCLS1|nr:predicted protein [Sclerotinia sclerotiorum 1980 UF-70]EDO03015.1 predicted protein [Sclerotinia sclerotiorum 1980 UF-70]